MRIVDPGDILAFVGGRLDERYVKTIGGGPAADQRARHAPGMPTGDSASTKSIATPITGGRRSTHCSTPATSSSWIFAVSRVPTPGACTNWISWCRALLPEQIVFVDDHTTDLRLLGNCLADGWRRAAHGSPQMTGSISCVRVERNSWPGTSAAASPSEAEQNSRAACWR